MKKLTLLLALLALSTACSPGFYTYKVTGIPGSEPGTVYIDATGIAGNEKDADNNAAFNVFNTLLFRGMPNSAQTEPLIADEAKAKSEHQDVLDCFKKFECYEKFIVSTEKVGLPQKAKNGTIVELRLKINLRSLRTYLEQNNVIRSFGF